MNNSQLDRVLNLIRRTGDRCVVLDRENDQVAVVMDLNEYEHLLDARADWRDLSETDMLDKINRDISAWKETHDRGIDDLNNDWSWENKNSELDEPIAKNEPTISYEDPPKEKSENYFTPPVNASSFFDQSVPENAVLSEISTPSDVPDFSASPQIEEKLTDVPADEDENEFYLEPVA